MGTIENNSGGEISVVCLTARSRKVSDGSLKFLSQLLFSGLGMEHSSGSVAFAPRLNERLNDDLAKLLYRSTNRKPFTGLRFHSTKH